MGTFSYYATDLSRYEEGNTEMGGILKRLVFEGRHGVERARGAAEPDRAAEDRSDPPQGPDAQRSDRAQLAELQAVQDVRVPFTVRWNRSGKTATRRDRRTRRIALERGKWTPWIDLTFKVNFARPRARHGADAAGERRQRAAAVRVAR